jgi:hypothetical protein
MSNEEKVVTYRYKRLGLTQDMKDSLHCGAEMVRKACAPRCGVCAGSTHVVDIEYEVGFDAKDGVHLGQAVESITIYVEIACDDTGSGCDWLGVEIPTYF